MSFILLSFLICSVNQAPLIPDSIIAQLYGDTSCPIQFIVKTSDPDNDKISYQFDWGDGNLSEWSEFNPSGYLYLAEYKYNTFGNYSYRVRAKDDKNNISEWSKSYPIIINPIIKWIYPEEAGTYSSVAVGPKQEIYYTIETGQLVSISPDGNFNWSFSTFGSIYSAPVVGKNAIYITTTDGKLFAIDFTGKEIWRFSADNSIYTTPAIDKNNTIYFGCDDGNLYALSSKGKLLWKFKIGEEIASSPIIDADGTVYIGASAVYAISNKGKKKWIFYPAEEDEVYFFATPALDDDGTIYFTGTDGALYTITKQGRLKWRALTPDEDAIRAGVAIDKNGIAYFGAENGILYKKEKFGEVTPIYETDYNIYSTPAIDTLGNIYFASDDGFFYCLQSNGKLLYKFEIADDSKEYWFSPSPIITNNNTLYIGSWQGKLYAVNAFAPLAKSSWPCFRYNEQNTGYRQK